MFMKRFQMMKLNIYNIKKCLQDLNFQVLFLERNITGIHKEKKSVHILEKNQEYL